MPIWLRSLLFLPFAVLIASGAASDDESGNATCDPSDQLLCACTDAGVEPVNNTVKACFLGDVNASTFVQLDSLSAQAFSALNWPVKLDENGKPIVGMPDYHAELKGDWTSVWETWKSTNGIFRHGPPLPWDETDYPLPDSCRELNLETERAKITYADQVPNDMQPRLLDEYLNPDGDALLDSNGVPVRYDVMFNKQAYDYTVENRLWDPRALEKYLEKNGKLAMPEGKWSPTARGAIVLKASWKILDNADKPGRFHKAWAYITPVIEDGKKSHDCALKPVGLVGLHIIYKTGLLPKWAWATFEHIDVAPLWKDIGPTANGHYENGDAVPEWLFYTPNKKGAARLNKPPKNALANVPSRIVEFYPPGYYFPPVAGVDKADCLSYGQDFRCFNERLKDGFSQSVMKNYHLKGTQWESSSTSDFIEPGILANTTMETFQQATSSCMGCHAYAGPEDLTEKGVFDYLFSFNRDVLQSSVPIQARQN